MNTKQALTRIGAISALIGAILLLVGTFLHPIHADPNIPADAFTEYAANQIWLASHLTQFFGVFALCLGFTAFSKTFEAGYASAWARFGLLGTAALVAISAALQAVDGVALKFMVDHWAGTTGEAQKVIFEAAFAVRQIEIGLASLFSITSGLTGSLFGMALLSSKRYPKWLGWLGFLNGVGMIVSGIIQGSTGFSGTAMDWSMTTSIVLLIWVFIVSVFMWRLAPVLAE
jgi:hypothetical protein